MTAVGTVNLDGIVYTVAQIHEVSEALDRAWQNANISEAARKDIEAALRVLQAGKPSWGPLEITTT